MATLAPGRARASDRIPPGLRRIAQISSSLTGTQAATALLGLAFWTLAARQFSVEAVGVAGAAVSLMLLLGTFGTFGLGTLLIARLPHTPQGDRRVLVRTSLAAAGALAAGLAVVVPLVAIAGLDAGLGSIAGTPPRAALFAVGTALMAVAIVLDQAVLVLGSGSLQLERNVVASATKVLVLLALGLTGATSGMAIFLAWTVGTLVSLPLVAFRTRGGRALESSGRLLDRASLRGLGRVAASHHALNTTLQAPLQLLPVVVLLVLSAGDNGIFSTALQVTGFVFALPYAISVGLFAAAEGDEHRVLSTMRFTLPLGLGVSLLATLVLLPFAPVVLSVFGATYSSEGAQVLRLLVLAGLPFVVRDHFVALRRVQGRTGHATSVLLGFTVVELLAAYAGARVGGTEGLTGAWVGVLYVEALVLGALLLRARRTTPTAEPAQATAGARALATGPAEPTPLLLLDQPSPTDRADEAVTSTLVRERPDAAAGSPTPRTEVATDVEVDEPPADPQPTSRRVGPGPALLLMTAGVLLVAVAADLARREDGSALARLLYVGGLLAMFVPAAVGVLLPGVQRRTLVLLAVALPVLLQLSRVALYPTRFMFHDELLHANVLRLIDSSGSLFSANPLLPISSFYPGLEIATNGVQAVTGLPPHTSAVVVLVLARVVLALAVLLAVERLTGSVRAAAVAAVAYACNPQMLFFNSQFSYQSLALPLAVLCAYLFLTRRRRSHAGLLLPLLALAAVAVTHHVTLALLVLALGAWWLLEEQLRRGEPDDAHGLAVLTVAGAAMLVATLLNPGNTLGSYLGAIVTSSTTDLGALLQGRSSKALFANSAGVANSTWEQVAILASLVLTLLVLAAALWHARRWVRTARTAALLLLAIAVLYPLVPGGHLTRATAEVGDRAAGFVYLGLAFVVGVWFVSRRRRLPRAAAVLCAGLAGVAFVGGVVLGAGPTAGQLPGPFRVSADARSVDPANVAAAQWLADNVPPGTPVYADRVSGLLAAAKGRQFTVRHISTGIDASRLLLSPDFGSADVEVIRKARIEYLIVDRRDAFSLPNQAVYIESGEFGEQGRTEPVSTEALTKFERVRGVDKVYDNGSLAIYDLRSLLRG